MSGMQRPYNISIYPGNGTADGVRGDHILIAPAFNITTKDVQHVANVTADVVEAFFEAKASPSTTASPSPILIETLPANAAQAKIFSRSAR